MTARPRITIAMAQSAEPRSAAWDLPGDIPGFSLRIHPSGRKVWRLRFRSGGRAGRLRPVILGDFPQMTPAAARDEAERLRGQVLAARRGVGVDPAAEREARKTAARKHREAPTVADLFDRFLDDRTARERKPTTLAEYARLLGVTPIRRGPKKGGERVGELRAALGRKKAADVTRGDIARLHAGMASRPYQANRALAILSAAFNFAEIHEHRPRHTNPCEGVEPYAEQAKERYLTDAELTGLAAAITQAETTGLPTPPRRRRWRATEATVKHRPKRWDQPKPANRVGVAALRFLILTGWREREALTLTWDAVDKTRRVALLRDTKTGKSERPLGAPALAVLDELERQRDAGAYPPEGHDCESAYVFPGTKRGAPFTDLGRLWDAVRHAAGLDNVRLHDIRHTFASVAASTAGLPLTLIGALLGHRDLQSTKRYAHLTEDARQRAAERVGEAFAQLKIVPTTPVGAEPPAPARRRRRA